jgi:large subunit ribosomal protein L10
MNRQEKHDLILQLKKQFHDHGSVFFVNYQGLSVNQLQELRRGVRKAHGSFQVAKVRLIQRAVSDLDSVKNLGQFCKGQLGVVFTSQQEQAMVKFLYDFSKKHTNLSLVVGHGNQKLLEKDMIVRLAQLPSREILLAQIAGTMNGLISQVARLLQALKTKNESV